MTDIVLAAESLKRVLPGEVPVTLIDGVDGAFKRGEFVAITGPSGSGKSSLLYLLGLLDRPSSGRIVIEGADTTPLPSEARATLRLNKIGFVFQFHFLLPEFSALGNVMVPMRKLGRWSEAECRDKAAALLGSFGLGDKLKRHPDQLSGGERQRVAIARALANDPLLVLADEPTGNLDSKNAAMVFDIFRRLARDEGRTIIVVTHEANLAATADRRVHLVDGRVANEAER